MISKIRMYVSWRERRIKSKSTKKMAIDGRTALNNLRYGIYHKHTLSEEEHKECKITQLHWQISPLRCIQKPKGRIHNKTNKIGSFWRSGTYLASFMTKAKATIAASVCLPWECEENSRVGGASVHSLWEVGIAQCCCETLIYFLFLCNDCTIFFLQNTLFPMSLLTD